MHPRDILKRAALLVFAAVASVACADDGRLPIVAPGDAGFRAEKLAEIDPVVATAIGEAKLPGCVVCIGRRGKIAWLKAYGNRALEPEKEAMTVDTVFDLASLTKPIATATSVMLLVEQGKLKVTEPVATYLPEF